MMLFKKNAKVLKLFVISGICAIGLYSTMGFNTSDDQQAEVRKKIQNQLEERTHISNALSEQIRLNHLPEKISITWEGKDETFSPKYTIDNNLQNEADKLLKAYKPDYGAIFMMDAVTGEVLAMSSFHRDNPAGNNLNLQATFPAASIF